VKHEATGGVEIATTSSSCEQESWKNKGAVLLGSIVLVGLLAGTVASRM